MDGAQATLEERAAAEAGRAAQKGLLRFLTCGSLGRRQVDPDRPAAL